MADLHHVCAVIPAFNPSVDLIALAGQLAVAGIGHIIIVNDGSAPEYHGIFDALPEGVTVLRHENNQGKGRALKTGFAHIAQAPEGVRCVVTCDADGQHAPGDVLAVARAALERPEAIVLGSRALGRSAPLRSRVGNALARQAFWLASRVRLRDTQTGLRAFSTALLPWLCALPGERYEYEIQMLLEAARRGISLCETPVHAVYIDGNASSHFHPLRDSLVIYRRLLRFSGASLLCAGLDFGLLFALRHFMAGLPESAALFVSVAGARVASASVNYAINRNVVFRCGNRFSAARYFALAGAVMAANYLLIYLLNVRAGLELFWAKCIVEITLFCASYLAQKRLVFGGTSGRAA